MQESKKKVLVLGGTGAMGVYLVPELARRGFCVDVVSLDSVQSEWPNVRYFQKNCKDKQIREELLSGGYDAIVDFMIYPTAEFKASYEQLLQSTSHYIYFSSYRVYANEEKPIRETSPRLLDVSRDAAFLATEDYSLYKARGEDLLHNSPYRNWTIVRPAITFSKRRFQLVTLEANVVVQRAGKGRTLLLPEEALAHEGTMSWAGDVAKMLACIVLNENAVGETYTLATAEHHPWSEIAAMYHELIGLRVLPVDTETFLGLFEDPFAPRYQLLYDRCFDRIVDNSKILKLTGLSQSDLMPLCRGLETELASLPKGYDWGDTSIGRKMDAYLSGH